MFNLQLTPGTTEAQATRLIFDACRANEGRRDWKGPEGVTVRFQKIAGKWLALVWDRFGLMVASAGVDEYDV